jgi:hypothetical protein
MVVPLSIAFGRTDKNRNGKKVVAPLIEDLKSKVNIQ